jgi:hypothetical protein
MMGVVAATRATAIDPDFVPEFGASVTLTPVENGPVLLFEADGNLDQLDPIVVVGCQPFAGRACQSRTAADLAGDSDAPPHMVEGDALAWASELARKGLLGRVLASPSWQDSYVQ